MTIGPRRQQAEAQLRELIRLERIGVRAANLVLADIRRAAVNAFKIGDPPQAVIAPRLHLLGPVMVDALTTSELRGILRAFTNFDAARKHKPKRMSAYSEMLDYLKDRIGMTDAAIDVMRRKYSNVAATMIQDASAEIERSLQRTLLNIRSENLIFTEGLKRFEQALARQSMVMPNANVIETVFRTQTAIGYAVGRANANAMPEIDEILWGYEYVTVGDDRVRPEHAALEGLTMPKDDPRWQYLTPPISWNCRCALLEIYFEGQRVDIPDQVEVDGELVTAGGDHWDISPAILLAD